MCVGGVCRESLMIILDSLQNLYGATDRFDESNPAWPLRSNLKSFISTKIVTAKSLLIILSLRRLDTYYQISLTVKKEYAFSSSAISEFN